MKITVLTVGKIKEKFYTAAIDEYSKRLSRYCKLNIIQVADEKTIENSTEKEMDIIKDKEGERILKNIPDDAFVIGGSLGLHQDVSKRANFKLSFSKMTFPHQLMRVILLEQIYRSYRIINNEPYHK